jgi:CTP synthase
MSGIGTLRLGAYDAQLAEGSKIAGVYGKTEISERHRHRCDVNINYRERQEKAGLSFVSM